MGTISAALGALILADDPLTFASLPHEVAKHILAQLPLDQRLRSREVSPAWREMLNDARLWTRINLGVGCGVSRRYLTERLRALALLRAACVRAKGTLQSVDLSGVAAGRVAPVVPFVLQWLDSASAANKASLRDLVAPPAYARPPTPAYALRSARPFLNAEQVTALCRALPLCRVRCPVLWTAVEALPLLGREPPFALLTIHELFVAHDDGDQALLDMTSALSVHKGMEKLIIVQVPLTTRAVDALVDAAISAGIKDMDFVECGLSQTALPALTRLLQSPGFEELTVHGDYDSLFEGPALPAFCVALRNCTSLKTLELRDVKLWADVAAAAQLIAALEGLPSLQELRLLSVRMDEGPATQRVGDCLARLIERSTCQRVLILSHYNWLGEANELGEAGLAAIFQALRGNSELVEMALMAEQVSADFARDVVLPAVRANTRLRKLFGFCWVDANGLPLYDDEQDPSLLEVQDILAARRQADEEAA